MGKFAVRIAATGWPSRPATLDKLVTCPKCGQSTHRWRARSCQPPAWRSRHRCKAASPGAGGTAAPSAKADAWLGPVFRRLRSRSASSRSSTSGTNSRVVCTAARYPSAAKEEPEAG